MIILRNDVIFLFPFFTKINQSLFPVEAAPAWFQAYSAAQTAVAHNALTTQITNIVAGLSNIRTAQTALAAQVANIKTAQTAQAALATTRHETLLIGLYNSRAVHFNGFAVRGDSVLQPLKGVNGNVPANFPATREALFALNVQACNDLLVAYNLPVDHTSRVKKGRLAIHIGLQH